MHAIGRRGIHLNNTLPVDAITAHLQNTRPGRPGRARRGVDDKGQRLTVLVLATARVVNLSRVVHNRLVLVLGNGRGVLRGCRHSFFGTRLHGEKGFNFSPAPITGESALRAA